VRKQFEKISLGKSGWRWKYKVKMNLKVERGRRKENQK
jgi:hypothetical protein